MDNQQIKNIVEAALMCAGQPLEINDILRLFEEDERPARKALDEVLDELAADYAERSVELKKVASGFRFQVRTQYSDWLGRLSGQRSPKYSRALLETLALVAYRQPVTRGEIESVRGVSVSSNIVRTLLERGWVRIVGHRDVPGRPAMLGTTKEFLDYFGLKTLDELPALSELKDFDSISVEFDLELPPALQNASEDGEPVEGSDEDSAEDGVTLAVTADDAESELEPAADDQDAAGQAPEQEVAETGQQESLNDGIAATTAEDDSEPTQASAGADDSDNEDAEPAVAQSGRS